MELKRIKMSSDDVCTTKHHVTIENKNKCVYWLGVTSHCAVNGTELVEDRMQSVAYL